MIKIGIMPSYNKNEQRPFLHTLSFVNNYPLRLQKAQALPIGILFPNGKFDEKLLEPYDGFLIPGGTTIREYHILTIHYAITHNKPLLGICLGLQALGLYDYLVSKLKHLGLDINYNNLTNLFLQTSEDSYLDKVDNHNKCTKFYHDSIHDSSHYIYVKNNSKLYDIYKKNKIIEPSIHNFVLKKISEDFIVSAVSNEAFIEAIEHKNKKFVVGIQFHPELEEKNKKLFETFINNCKNS